MDILLDRRGCAVFDSGVSSRFEQIVIVPKEAGVYVQGMDKSKTVAVDHFVDRMVFLSYSCTAKDRAICVPNMRMSMKTADTLRVFTSGAVLKMVWTSEEVVLEKSVYVLDGGWSLVKYPPFSVTFTLSSALFSMAARLSEGPLAFSVLRKKVEIKGVLGGRVSMRMAAPIPRNAYLCRFSLSRYQIERVSISPVHTSVSVSVHSSGLAVLFLEVLGANTTVTISSEVKAIEKADDLAFEESSSEADSSSGESSFISV